MKKYIFILFFASLFFSCEEKDKPAPELSSQVAGRYSVNKLKVDGVNYPLDRAEVVVELAKSGSDAVTGVMKVKIDGEAEPDEEIGTLNLKGVGSTGVDIYEGTAKVGNVSRDNVLSIFVEFEGQEFEMIANKR